MKATQSPQVKAGRAEAKIIPLHPFKQPQQAKVESLVNALWGLCQSAFWNNQVFTSKEIVTLKELLAEHFYNGVSSEQNFKELAERLCLAKRYVSRRQGRYVAKPQDYLNIHYERGLTGTASWYQQVKAVRKNVPDYNKGISVFSKALLAFTQTPTKETYFRARKQLIAEKQFDLLPIFNSTAIHILFH